MSRIRSIKPEFWSSKTLAKVSRDARLTFIGLWGMCDDTGVMLDAPKTIAGEIFPHDDDIGNAEIIRFLTELRDAGLIHRVSENGKDYIIIRSWDEHQKIDKPSKHRWISREDRDRLSNVSRNLREGVERPQGWEKEKEKEKEDTSSLRSDVGAAAPEKFELREDFPNSEHRPKSEAPKPTQASKRPPDPVRKILETVLSPEVAAGVIEHRRKKRAVLTEMAAEGLAKKFAATGQPDNAARWMVERGHQGFEIAWWEKALADDRQARGGHGQLGSQLRPPSPPGDTHRARVTNMGGGMDTVPDDRLAEWIARWQRGERWAFPTPPPGEAGCRVPEDLLPTEFRQQQRIA